MHVYRPSFRQHFFTISFYGLCITFGLSLAHLMYMASTFMQCITSNNPYITICQDYHWDTAQTFHLARCFSIPAAVKEAKDTRDETVQFSK